MAAAEGGRIVISDVGAAGVEEVAATTVERPERIALAEGWIAWTQEAGPPVVATWAAGAVTPAVTPLAKPSGRIELLLAGETCFAAHGTSSGIELLQVGEPTALVVTEGDTVSHTLFSVDGTVWIAWADQRGVWARTFSSGQLGTTRHIDDGAVSGEPAHRIGASIAGGVVNGEPLLAYQDQTTGALITSRLARRTMSQSHPSPEFSRGYHISLLPVGERLLVVDSALKVQRGLTGTFFATVQ